MNTYCPVSTEIVSHLAQLVGERNISTRQSDLDLHAQDQSAHEAHCPEVIVWVENAEQISRVLAYARFAPRFPPRRSLPGNVLHARSGPEHANPGLTVAY